MSDLPAHWRRYLTAFDAFLASSTPMEARTMRGRMDGALDRALAAEGQPPAICKRPSVLEGDMPRRLVAMVTAPR